MKFFKLVLIDNKIDKQEEDQEQQEQEEGQESQEQEIGQEGQGQSEGQEEQEQGEGQGEQEQGEGQGEQEQGEGQEGQGQEEGQEGQEQEEGQEGQEQEEGQEQDAKKTFRELLQVKPESISKNPNPGLELENIKNLGNDEISDSIINVLIEKFLNFTFIPKKDDLNSTRESLIPTVGDVKWNIPDLIRHKTTKQYNQMLHDKYGYTKEAGSDDKIPLAFYFDLSPSMAEYSRFLALISLKILKKNVSVLIGANEMVHVQINRISQTTTLEDLKHILESPYCIDRKGVEIEQVGRILDEYLREKGAKRVAVFSDFDPKGAIENLSEFAEIYWFCFEERENSANTSLSNFKGRFYKTRNIEDFVEHLKNIKNRYYEHLQRAQMEGGQERDD